MASAVGTTTIFVGSSLDPVNESVDATTRLVVVGIPVLIAVVAIATWLLVGRALRPVELIRAEVADISEGDLHRRVPEPDTDDEVGDSPAR